MRYTEVMLLLVFFSSFAIRKSYSQQRVINVPPYWLSFIFAAYAIVFFAMFPVPWGTWADRHCYAYYVLSARQGFYGFQSEINDIGFAKWIIWTSKMVSYQGWFYLTALVYVGNYWWASWRFTREYSYVLFLMIICCFQFTAYGTNTIRAGFAISFVFLGLSFCNDLRKMAVCLIIALLCHKSTIIPISAIILAYNLKKTKIYIWGWLLCVFFSYFFGESLQERFSFLVTENRTSYLTTDAAHTFYKVGFRWDFLLYSSIPILLGYYYIIKLNFRNEFYEFVYRMYLAANGFWVLVIRANYTDRFAYLSWFLFPLLLSYPVLSKQLYRNAEFQSRNILLVLFGEFGFALMMYIRDGGSLFGFRLF